MRWQLASHWPLLQTACHSDVSWGLPINGNHCAWTQDHNEICPLSLSRSVVTSYEVRLAAWLPATPVSLRSSSNTKFWREDCNRRWREASCHLLATDTWHRFILHRDTISIPTVGKMLKCHWRLRWGPVCSLYCPCTTCTQKSEKKSWRQECFCLTFLNSLAFSSKFG
jgi:hypothetical protein